MNSVVNLVVALQPEARPIIDHFSLTARSDCEPFGVFSGDGIRLIVSGIGKVASAAAAGFLFHSGGCLRDEAWLNVGIAGHADLPVGSARLAHKITDNSSSANWYPPRVLDASCPTGEVRCVERAEQEFAGNALYEMESAGVVPTCIRFATSELVHVLKIVSDNNNSPADQISRQRIRVLVGQQVPLIEDLIRSLRHLSERQQSTKLPPAEFTEFVARWHFSETQTHQLREALRRWHVLRKNQSILAAVEGLSTSRDVLRALQHKIDGLPVRLQNE